MIKDYTTKMDGMDTKIYINILPLGSYYFLIGMDWLEKYSTLVNYHDKIFSCLDDFCKNITVKGIPWGVSVRQIFQF
jgi:predicted aspartyl protease